MKPLWSSVVILLLPVVTIIGNWLVIVLIVKRRRLRTKSNYFVLSLAVADFSSGAVHPSTIFSGDSGFVLLGRLLRYLFFVSITSLCALTLDRYLAIVRPLKYMSFMTMRRVSFFIALAWALPLVLYLAPSLALKLGSSTSWYNQCFIALICFVDVCACLVLLLATTRIFLIVRRHAKQNAVMVKQLKFNHALQYGRAFRPQEAASAKVVGFVVGIFIICYAVTIYQNICRFKLCKRPVVFREYRITNLLKLLNSAVNPIAYAFFKKDIKKELKRLFISKGV